MQIVSTQNLKSFPISCISRFTPLLEYERYLRLEARLRSRRRELLLFCQHPPTLTAGLQAQKESLLLSLRELNRHGLSHFNIGRGGDYTAHEPGQLLIYPHIDLRKRKIKIHDYLELLLGISSRALEKIWDLHVTRDPERPGLYYRQGKEVRKIASIGIMCKAFFTSFGLALNVSNSLSSFSYIKPCGYESLKLCSVQNCGGDAERLGSFISFWQEEFLISLPRLKAVSLAPQHSKN